MQGNEQKFAARSAIEALRTGVPNSYSVRALGCDQPRIESAFAAQLDAAAGTQPAKGKSGGTDGLLIKGDFGTGKSHSLEYLREFALERNFVVSRVYVNKETPMHDPQKLFQGASDNLSLPVRSGPAFTEIANQLVFNSQGYRELERWANTSANMLDPRFPASLVLFEHFRADHEYRDSIVRFWAGGKMGVAEMRSKLRQIGQPFTVGYTSLRDLAVQRFRFAARLIRAAGYAGWVVLVDEVELTGTYSALQRAKSYVEIARLMDPAADPGAPILPVLAITDDFTRAVLEEKGDLHKVPSMMQSRAVFSTADVEMAVAGMRILAERGISLKRPDSTSLDEAYSRIRELYRVAYAWEPAATSPGRRESSTPMRAYIRRWITEWDLRRLNPGVNVDVETVEWRMDYRERVGKTGGPEVRSDQSLIDDVLGDI